MTKEKHKIEVVDTEWRWFTKRENVKFYHNCCTQLLRPKKGEGKSSSFLVLYFSLRSIRRSFCSSRKIDWIYEVRSMMQIHCSPPWEGKHSISSKQSQGMLHSLKSSQNQIIVQKDNMNWFFMLIKSFKNVVINQRGHVDRGNKRCRPKSRARRNEM